MRTLFHETKHEKFRGALIKLDSKLSKQTQDGMPLQVFRWM
jgi:hypothetical protein